MGVSIQTGIAEQWFGLDNAFRMFREAGFTGVDANINDLFHASKVRTATPFPAFLLGDEKEALEAFKPMLEASKKYGLPITQAHSLYPSALSTRALSAEHPGYDAMLLEASKKFIVGAAFLECPYLVFHPVSLKYTENATPEEMWERNMEFFGALAETAKREGVILCLENVFTTVPGGYETAPCSSPADSKRYVDTLNEMAGGEVFGFCLDTGHANLLGIDCKDYMVEMGNRLKCFHINDNDTTYDQHRLPHMGTVNWDHFIEGLKEIDFQGDLSFETFRMWDLFGKDLGPQVLRFTREIGEHFLAKMKE